MLYYQEGPVSIVTVGKDHATGALWLANNGKVEATSEWDLPTQVLCGLLPRMYLDEASDVLLIGLASGITAGALAADPGVQRLDVVEIEPATVEAARWFSPWNHAVLDDPRLNLIINDGRNHLLRTDHGQYDLVVSEAI